jgi:hypothetical protein
VAFLKLIEDKLCDINVVERNNKSKTLLCDGDNCKEDGGYGHCIKCKSTFCKDHFKGEWYECEQYDKTKAENIENKLQFEKTLPDIGHPGICMECFVTNDEESEEEISVPSTSEDDIPDEEHTLANGVTVLKGKDGSLYDDESWEYIGQWNECANSLIPDEENASEDDDKDDMEEHILADGLKVIKGCDGTIYDNDSFEYLGKWNECANTLITDEENEKAFINMVTK